MDERRGIVKKVNYLFLTTILLYLLIVLFAALMSVVGLGMGNLGALFLGEVVILLPALIFILANRWDVREMIPFRKIKASSFWFTVLLAICIMLPAQWINIVSQLFTDSPASAAVLEIVGEIPFGTAFFAVAIFGPLCEEVVFRGVIFQGLRKSSRIVLSAVISALFFGLMHMNLNQFLYTFFLGFVLAMLTEATGSIVTPFIVHFIVNGYNIIAAYVLIFLSSGRDKGLSAMIQSSMERGPSKLYYFFAAGMYFIPALLASFLAFLLYKAICKREGSLEHIKGIFKKKDEGGRREAVVTAGGYIGIVICSLVILFLDTVMKLFT
ncbi:MAG: CPBP family intramembrane metalloprotease [Lachnospiraceae bacterium]|nr:CPBP family intramembrane metalloprotease [Lachnospiraceae bacterium]